VSVDSMQVYRGLDIGTAKPSAPDRARVPHHLMDIVDLQQTFDAAQFVHLAQQTVAEIKQRGRLPILCGGTGLYFKALLSGLGSAPPADPALRAQLEKVPIAELLRELSECDPITYARIDRQNPRRVIRAIEVIRLTGKPFSAQRADWLNERPGATTAHTTAEQERQVAPVFCLNRTSGDLHRRIESRVEAMFERGLVAETRDLLARGLERNPTAMQALGYRQVVEHLRGARSLAETIQLVKIRTRQFAKRQLTWLRRQLNAEWIHVDANEPAATTAERVKAEFRKQLA